ncbi:reverse transcriptase-like protein [Sphingomonas sp. 28-63-12]|uniref:reverse transcriptase-like protein n=1 Tax=Sphingomonas sp. 28-63-12 TaxID=1970434 RepID=UPI000BD4061E|nr:MAG: ribonuclease HI [Sphingomonas sp. 28-63-12]
MRVRPPCQGSPPRASAPLKIYFDGGCRPNPGAIEVAVVVAGTVHVRRDLGQGSSADAEWLALIHAVGIAQLQGLTDFVLLGDAKGVVGQASSKARCRGAAIGHHARLMAMLAPGQALRIRYIKRTQNLAGIALARLHDR